MSQQACVVVTTCVDAVTVRVLLVAHEERDKSRYNVI